VSAAQEKSLWWCVQAGHRERYAVPRALALAGILDRLATDLWVPPSVAWLLRGAAGRRLRDRYHPDLSRRNVTAVPFRWAAFELMASLKGEHGALRVLHRNQRWSALAARTMVRKAAPTTSHVFSYCYDAREVFRAARRRGLHPVLGQIDPGPLEDKKTELIVQRWRDFQTTFKRGSVAYYDAWRDECDLAQRIVVNSDWSREALEKEGVDASKLVVWPLVYSPPAEAANWRREFPGAFTMQRPLRLLFLGQCILRKGIAETIEAARRLIDRPVEFTFVGNTDIAAFESHFGGARIVYHPRVSREECHRFYREADIFIFPTHSDGFGLTQLEAQAWRLPILASRFCAQVVVPGKTGWIMPEVSGETMAAIIEQVLAAPATPRHFSEAIEPWPFSLGDLGARLAAISEEGHSR